jgi:L-lactate dehydrogenase complex protein LldG
MASERSAREEILGCVCAALGGPTTAETALSGWHGLPRKYRRSGLLHGEAVVELFIQRLEHYDATAVRCGAAEVAPRIGARLAAQGKKRLLVAEGLAREWLPAGFEFVVDQGASAKVLDGFEGIVTGATVAIAETGTVVLQNVAGQGRRAATLVPDYHLCLVRLEDIVETVPEAIARICNSAGLATTFVSGPSATADIEMTRIKGVHGPRVLDVLLIG